MPFTRRFGLQGIREPDPREKNHVFPGSSHGLRLLFRGGQAPSRRFTAAPPTRFLPLQRFPARGSGMMVEGPNSTACAFRYSQPLGALVRPELAGLIPCRIRSWGHPPELCSSRVAVRCFQRRSPRGVRTAFRVLLHARVLHPVQLFKLKTERVALLGIFPSRVLTLSTLVRPSSDLPSCGC
jgi:hypothetical protein